MPTARTIHGLDAGVAVAMRKSEKAKAEDAAAVEKSRLLHAAYLRGLDVHRRAADERVRRWGLKLLLVGLVLGAGASTAVLLVVGFYL